MVKGTETPLRQSDLLAFGVHFVITERLNIFTNYWLSQLIVPVPD
jgi:hypothetical protein